MATDMNYEGAQYPTGKLTNRTKEMLTQSFFRSFD